MKKYISPLLFIIASLLAIFGQDLAYFLSNYLIDIYPVYHLTGITIMSIILFIIFAYYSLFTYIKYNSSDGNALFKVFLSITVAILMSIWSLFVLLMWWG